MTEHARPPEITFRGMVLGCLLTLLFTAANLYLGLKIGLTFATSIPAAVISMALLRGLGGSNLFENNIVQTIASAAGTLASIGFVLPGLVMVGWWHGFDPWPTFWICATGGLLGVLFSVPLRRALVTGSDLPYPEGVAAAAVLRVGSETAAGAAESRAGLRAIVLGSVAALVMSALSATQLAAGAVTRWFRMGPVGSGIDASLQLALIGAGHLVGLSVGIAIGWGLVLGYGVVTPLLTWAAHAPGDAEAIWAHQTRFFGAGVIAIASLWTLGTLVMPILRGLRESLAASRARQAGGSMLAIEEQDIPLPWLAAGLAMLALPIAWVLARFVAAGPLAGATLPLMLLGLLFVIVTGAIVSAVCGYMAGLIGASNSPVSGLGILGVVGAGLMLAALVQPRMPPAATPHLVALTLFLTAIIFCAATIANDNLQDLKTGQLVGATPWKQQVALMIGVIAGSAVIPFTLALLNRAYGFAPLDGPAPAAPMAAPQATLLSTLARGLLGQGLDWGVIGAGGAAGAALIAVDALCGRMGWRRVPPLAVGLGVYLPMGATLPVVIGAAIGAFYERRNPSEPAHRLGVLLASGFIVGDGLFGVALAALIVATGSGTPLALVGDAFAPAGVAIGLAAFAGLIAVSYRRTAKAAARLS